MTRGQSELTSSFWVQNSELLRDRFLLGEIGVTIEVNLGILQVRLVAVAIGNGLIELRPSSLADLGGT